MGGSWGGRVGGGRLHRARARAFCRPQPPTLPRAGNYTYVPSPGVEARPSPEVEGVFASFERAYETQYGRALVRANPAAEPPAPPPHAPTQTFFS